MRFSLYHANSCIFMCIRITKCTWTPFNRIRKNYLFKLVCYIKVIKVKSEDIRMEAKRQILDTA